MLQRRRLGRVGQEQRRGGENSHIIYNHGDSNNDNTSITTNVSTITNTTITNSNNNNDNNTNLSNPKPGHTTGGSGRSARRSGRAESGMITVRCSLARPTFVKNVGPDGVPLASPRV